jgi:hypothetical protein
MNVSVPSGLVMELGTVWALLPATPTDGLDNDAVKKSIGNRGELYSYQYERLQASSQSSIIWVARDDETLGYDIEDRATSPRRLIEVKASRGKKVTFLLSDKEWRMAHANPGAYEIQFWGGIDLQRDVAEEYSLLRAEGYPLVLKDLPSLLAASLFTAQTDKWRVSQATPIP